MGQRLYKATGSLLTLWMKSVGLDLRLGGAESLPDAPTLFVVNHFTRIETVLVPYAVYHRFGRTVRSLATPAVFRGLLGRYLNCVGVVSVRDPRRNRTIISDLMTGRADWVIYPEGGLIKNKKVVHRGKLRLERPGREGPPHTGAAILALKSEIIKKRYLDVCKRGQALPRTYYEEQYDLTGPREVCPRGTVVVPVNITFHDIRTGDNLVSRLGRRFIKDIDPRFEEELRIEGHILAGNAEISVHFDQPIDVREFINRGGDLLRRVVRRFDESHQEDKFLGRPARRLTQVSMRSIYSRTEVSFDHLFFYALRASRCDVISVTRFHKALCLAAMLLRQAGSLRLHPALQNGVTALVTGRSLECLEQARALALKEGVLHRINGEYIIDRGALDTKHDFHCVRVNKMSQVFANELEPVGEVTDIIRRAVNLSERQLDDRLWREIGAADRHEFKLAYDRLHKPGVSKPPELGEPFLLHSRRDHAGVILVHGYLACPQQVRPLAEYLHSRGYTVYGARLAGHGTAPEQLGRVAWEHWLDSVHHGYAALRPLCSSLFVGGFSLGGIMSLLLAAELSDGLDGVFTINAPMKLRDRRAHFVPALVTLNRVLRGLRLTRDDTSRTNFSEDPELNYEMDDLRGVREVRRAIRACRRALPAIKMPVQLLQSDADPLVSPRSAEIIRARLANRDAGIIPLRSERHVIIRGDGVEQVFAHIHQFLDDLKADAPRKHARRDSNPQPSVPKTDALSN